MIKNIDYHITDNCNLNCKSCGHFCPLVPKDKDTSRDLAQVARELKLLSGRLFGKFENLTITGGEATLNDQLPEILKIARDLFSCNIKLWTNGILVNRILDIKDIIAEYQITVCVSEYPYEKSMDNITRLKSELGDNFYYVTRLDNSDNTIYFRTKFFDFNPVDSPNAKNCYARYNCLQYRNERIYPCQYLAYWDYFRDYFKESDFIPQSDEWGFKIIENTTVQELETWIENFDCIVCHYCRDCDNDLIDTMPWDRSKKELSEWMKN